MRSIHPLFVHFSYFFLLLSPIQVASSTRCTAITKSSVTGSWSCGNITVQRPLFLHRATSALPSPTLAHSLLCKSQNLYLRTSLGLFPVSSINNTAKTLTLSSPPCASPSSRYISPVLLASAFSAPPQPHNSLLLFNCASHKRPPGSFPYNCTTLFSNVCASKSAANLVRRSPCLLLRDVNELEVGFHPSNLGCSHYSRVFVDPSSFNHRGLKFGTRVSFGIPVHLPSICEECSKPGGYCGVGLRCICHPKQCEDRILSSATTRKPVVLTFVASIVCYILSLVVIT